MPRIFRQPNTKPIPKGAEIILIKGEKHARWKKGDKVRKAPLTKAGDRIRLYSSLWYGAYINADGEEKRVPLSLDKDAAQIMLGELVRKAELERVGVVNRHDSHQARPLSEHLDDFKTMLADKGITEKQVGQKTSRVRKLLVNWCEFTTLGDIDEQKVQRIAREKLSGDQTRRHYLTETKSFTAWLFRARRVPHDPLAILVPPKVREIRRRRRALLEPELRTLLDIATKSERIFRGLAGRDRAMLYTMAIYTGYRAKELSKLTPQHLRLTEQIPHVFLAGTDTKNGQPARQPLPPAVADELAKYVAGRNPLAPIWGGAWRLRASKMLKHDLKAAAIPVAVERPEGKLVIDFHSLRHSFIRMLSQAGIPLRRSMQLARHSDPKLTAITYGSEDLAELASAIRSVPDLLKRELSDRGYHETIRRMLEVDLPSLPPGWREYAAASPELAHLWAESCKALETMSDDKASATKRFMYQQYLNTIKARPDDASGLLGGIGCLDRS